MQDKLAWLWSECGAKLVYTASKTLVLFRDCRGNCLLGDIWVIEDWVSKAVISDYMKSQLSTVIKTVRGGRGGDLENKVLLVIAQSSRSPSALMGMEILAQRVFFFPSQLWVMTVVSALRRGYSLQGILSVDGEAKCGAYWLIYLLMMQVTMLQKRIYGMVWTFRRSSRLSSGLGMQHNKQ